MPTVHINCDCSAYAIEVSQQQIDRWKYGPRCRVCKRVLGPMQWSVVHPRGNGRRVELDPTWLQETVNDLRDQGCDKEFIQCCVDELLEGGEVTVVFEE